VPSKRGGEGGTFRVHLEGSAARRFGTARPVALAVFQGRSEDLPGGQILADRGWGAASSLQQDLAAVHAARILGRRRRFKPGIVIPSREKIQ